MSLFSLRKKIQERINFSKSKMDRNMPFEKNTRLGLMYALEDIAELEKEIQARVSKLEKEFMEINEIPKEKWVENEMYWHLRKIEVESRLTELCGVLGVKEE